MKAHNLSQWEKRAWADIVCRTIKCPAYNDVRHSAVYLDSTWAQALMLELIRDAAKLRLTS